jgi:hypothetical protein
MSNIKEVIERHSKELMKIKGVIGLAAGLCEPDSKEMCIKIYVTGKVQKDELPKILEGYRVQIIEKKSVFKAFRL